MERWRREVSIGSPGVMLGRPGLRLNLRGVAALLHVAAGVAAKSLLRLAVNETMNVQHLAETGLQPFSSR